MNANCSLHQNDDDLVVPKVNWKGHCLASLRLASICLDCSSLCYSNLFFLDLHYFFGKEER
jgi:hypothetical protein